MAQASLRLLGGFRAQLSSGVAVTLPTRKAQALLAYLALPPGRAHPRDKLAALLWGDVPQARARGALRQALFALRRGLPTVPPALRLEGRHSRPGHGGRHRRRDDVRGSRGRRSPRRPGARGRALPGGSLGRAQRDGAFEEWLAFERERLRELALETMARPLAHQRSAGTAEAAIRTALGLLALDPLQEPVHRTLMRLYTGLGRRGAALRQYQVCVDALQRELGTAPEAATRRLYEEILRQSPAEAFAPAAPGGPAVEDLPRDTPLIGRGAELVRLRAAVDGAARGSGRVVAIVGEAGIGKSRLVAEVCAEASARGVRVLVGRAHEAEQILGFGVWAEILRGARPGDDPALLAALGAPWRAALASLLPEVAAPGSSSAEPTDYRRLFESVARVVEHLGGRQSLLVVIEDAHWADDMSVRLLAFLGRRLAASPVLLVVTAREEDLADAPALRRLLEDPAPDAPVTVALGRLARDETLALVSALSRAAGDAEALATRGETVWIASEGNPFMVVESVRALDASDGPPPRALLPERVRAVIQRRLDRLGGPARELAVVAAVIGRDVDFALLHRATGMDEASAASQLEDIGTITGYASFRSVVRHQQLASPELHLPGYCGTDW